jgi:5-methyltetrahydropteroyltriglutamate--homocysteine methyltransferase
MQTSQDRILTTHVGSLPRPPKLLTLLLAKERGEPQTPLFEAEVDCAVEAVVAEQIAAGIDVVSDGGDEQVFLHLLYEE